MAAIIWQRRYEAQAAGDLTGWIGHLSSWSRSRVMESWRSVGLSGGKRRAPQQRYGSRAARRSSPHGRLLPRHSAGGGADVVTGIPHRPGGSAGLPAFGAGAAASGVRRAEVKRALADTGARRAGQICTGLKAAHASARAWAPRSAGVAPRQKPCEQGSAKKTTDSGGSNLPTQRRKKRTVCSHPGPLAHIWSRMSERPSVATHESLRHRGVAQHVGRQAPSWSSRFHKRVGSLGDGCRPSRLQGCDHRAGHGWRGRARRARICGRPDRSLARIASGGQASANRLAGRITWRLGGVGLFLLPLVFWFCLFCRFRHPVGIVAGLVSAGGWGGARLVVVGLVRRLLRAFAGACRLANDAVKGNQRAGQRGACS